MVCLTPWSVMKFIIQMDHFILIKCTQIRPNKYGVNTSVEIAPAVNTLKGTPIQCSIVSLSSRRKWYYLSVVNLSFRWDIQRGCNGAHVIPPNIRFVHWVSGWNPFLLAFAGAFIVAMMSLHCTKKYHRSLLVICVRHETEAAYWYMKAYSFMRISEVENILY